MKDIEINYYSERGSYFLPHAHRELEMHYIFKGFGTVVMDGKEHRLSDGDFFVIHPGAVHEAVLTEVSQGLQILVPEEFLEYYVPGFEQWMILCGPDKIRTGQWKDYEKICENMQSIPGIYTGGKPGARLAWTAKVMDILAVLVNVFGIYRAREDGDAATDPRHRIQEMAAYVEEHHMEDLTLEMIAGNFGLSREYFSRFFKKYMGVNFIRHLHLVRLTHIHEELLSSEDSIMEIVSRHGFNNYKLFTKMFREIYGCAPRTLRKVREGKNGNDEKHEGQ